MAFKLKYGWKEGAALVPPPSKSYAQRALIVASLAEGRSHLKMSEVEAEDISIMVSALKEFGVQIEVGHEVTAIDGGHLRAPAQPVNCGLSGATIRFLTSFSTLVPNGSVLLTGEPDLLRRPIGPLIDAITKLGGSAESLRVSGFPPVRVKGGGLKGGFAVVESSSSSQFISSLLMVSPLAKEGVRLEAKGLVSSPYVEMTISTMKDFGVMVRSEGMTFSVHGGGYNYADFDVPADMSAASFFMCMAVLRNSAIKIGHVNLARPQADSKIVDILRLLGVTVTVDGDSIQVRMRDGELRSDVEIDLKDSPDIFPPLATLGLLIPITFRGIAHTRLKESDRIRAMGTELTRLGANVLTFDDGVRIVPPKDLKRGVRLNGWNDHRVVMALSIADAALELDCTIEGRDAVRKSYPGFFRDLGLMGIEVENEHVR
ncbi:MAG: 3-phosphoshikimate 1-carboxyvinyltransferase [Nitrososphaerota archaeon]|nr:3-phosphoshikimate 1-carboxyvinyltransferase [Nitrososphaerota archaeon]MDG7036173.1 3-phosphoshikimate 1-carboxyvinyltransferase [Nitrososphaerota archaeon]